jgi:hypothetical protein
MSRQNGDRSRFQINRKRKMLRRQRLRALLTALRGRRDGLKAVAPVITAA